MRLEVREVACWRRRREAVSKTAGWSLVRIAKPRAAVLFLCFLICVVSGGCSVVEGMNRWKYEYSY